MKMKKIEFDSIQKKNGPVMQSLQKAIQEKKKKNKGGKYSDKDYVDLLFKGVQQSKVEQQQQQKQ